MGLCSSSSTSKENTYMDENDPQAYEARMERLDQANEKNFLSIRSFPIVKELGCGIAELWSNSIEKVQGESTEDEANQTRETTEELDGVFTLVTVQNQATDRRLRMRTFLRKYLLSGGKDIAAVRVRPFVNSILTLSSVTPNQYILSLEYAFFNRTDCVIVSGNYLTDLEMLMRHGFHPKENEALGIICSVILAVQHLHQSKIIVGNDLAASNVLVEKDGRARLSLFPISVTRIGYKRKAINGNSNEQDDAATVVTTAAATTNNTDNANNANNANSTDPVTSNSTVETKQNAMKDSPGAKYRIQTKESEVRGDHNEDATLLRKNMARDYLLCGRLAAQVFGIQKENNQVLKDSDVIERAKGMNDPAKSLIVGLLNPNQDERWNYLSIKKLLSMYDWEKLEDIKEEIYPPSCINIDTLNDFNLKIMDEAKKIEEGDDEEENETNGKDAHIESKHNNNADEKEDKESDEESDEDSVEEDLDKEFIDHGDDDDIESDYGDDELLPWEAQEILGGWEYNSTVLALHQLSNHLQTNKMADFASYDAEFYKPQGLGGRGSGGDNDNTPKLRDDLKNMGSIISKELKKT